MFAEKGGGGWNKYDLSRVGQRHKRVREVSYVELRAEAAEAIELQIHMDSLRGLLHLPECDFNALMERVAAVILQHDALEEQADDDVATSSVPDESEQAREERASQAATDRGVQAKR